MNNSIFKSVMRILIVLYYYHHKNCMLYRVGRKGKTD